MKIKQVNAGILTNFEVLDFLRSKGASKDSLRDVISSASSSELKVFDYLDESPACNQTKESIVEFVEKCSKFNLAKAEILNIINLRPTSPAEICAIVEEYDTRIESTADELVKLVTEVLPPPKIDNVKEDSTPEQMEGIEEN